MYSFNYIEGVITKEKYGSTLVRFLKLLNFFVHIGIILIFLFTVFRHFETVNYNKKIIDTKNKIEQKRTQNSIIEIEKEWETYYYKILAVKEQIKGSTNYGSILKDFGTFLPEGDSIINLSMAGEAATSDWFISKEKVKKLTSFYDYAPILNSAFEKSECIKNDMVIETMEKQNIYKREVNALKLKIGLKKAN
ncbi:hypothetical protein [Candidatus Ruminimicrobiellum ovillum]|uniref:hypothetical protein n=1 Tax=Candidatus Ruminimicrobiellum ovillum TaxID=1947927 RepID=UPI003559FFB5